MMMSKAVGLLLLVSAVWAASPKCREVRPTMMTCLEGTGEDIPTTKQAKVEWLVLTRCNVPIVKKTYMDNFPALTDFHASSAKVETIEPKALNGLKLLDWVDLSENKLTNIPVDLVAECPKLTHLNISHNPLVIPENRPFLNSANLKWLDLQNAGIKKLYDSTFRSLPKLEVLSLKGNLLESLPAELFQHQTKMVSLRLDGNKMKLVSAEVFKGMKPMVVYLADNPWNCDCSLYPLIQWTKRNLVKDEVRCSKPDTKEWKTITTMKCEPIK